MISTLDEDLGILEKYNLSPTELFVVKLFFLLQEDGIESYLGRYINIPENNLRETLLTLQNKGVVLKSYKIPEKNSNFDPYDVEFNKNFVKGFLKASFELGKELYEAYPKFGIINNAYVGLRTVSKKYNSLEDAYLAYGKAINWSQEKHREIIDLLNWCADKQVICCSLASFIIDRRWEFLKDLRDGDLTNINYDAVKMV